MNEREKIGHVLEEIERRWRARTPAKRIDEIDPGTRVPRSEVRLIASEYGLDKRFEILNDDFDRAILQMFSRLQKEFPNEHWSRDNCRTIARKRELGRR